MKLSARYLVFICFVFSIGCAVTHPRAVSDIKVTAAKTRKVLVLIPEVEPKVKYISTREFVDNKAKTEQTYTYLFTGYRDHLEELGYEFYAAHLSLPEEVLFSEELKNVKNELRELGDQIISDDPEYYHEKMEHKFVRTLKTDFPKAFEEFDAVILCYGRANVESDREFWQRWTKNAVYNIVLLPFIFAIYVFPVALPFTVGVSNLAFEASPDNTFVKMVMCDTHSKKIVYQNDYAMSGWGFSEDEFRSIAIRLLEGLPAREQEEPTN